MPLEVNQFSQGEQMECVGQAVHQLVRENYLQRTVFQDFGHQILTKRAKPEGGDLRSSRASEGADPPSEGPRASAGGGGALVPRAPRAPRAPLTPLKARLAGPGHPGPGLKYKTERCPGALLYSAFYTSASAQDASPVAELT